MSREILQVDGMTCNHCVQTVTQAIQSLAGIRTVAVDLDAKTVAVDYDEAKVGKADISAKILAVGFEVAGT